MDVLIIWTADVRNDQIPAESNTTFAFAPLIASHITVIKQCLANDMIRQSSFRAGFALTRNHHKPFLSMPQNNPRVQWKWRDGIRENIYEYINKV